MSDYLGSLAARAAAPNAAVRPHLLSLFHPTPLSPRLEGGLEKESELVSEPSCGPAAPPMKMPEVASSTSKDAPFSVEPRPKSDASVSRIEPRRSEAELAQAQAQPEKPRAVRNADSLIFSEPRREERAPREDAIVGSQKPDSPSEAVRVLRQVVPAVSIQPPAALRKEPAAAQEKRNDETDEAPVVAAPTPHIVFAMTPAEPSMAPEQRTRPKEVAVSSDVKEEPALAMNAKLRTESPVIRPASPLPNFPKSAPIQTEPAPTVHVTIGRLEVKAAPPPPAPRRASAAKPSMNLEQYLKSRGGHR